MTLTSVGPAGTDADPFAGTPSAAVEVGLPIERYRRLGATDADVEALQQAVEQIPADTRRAILLDLNRTDDETLRGHLDSFREIVVLSAAWEALTPDEQEALLLIPEPDRIALLHLDDDERDALRAYVAAMTTPTEPAPAQPTPEPAPAEPGGAETSTEQQPTETETFVASDVVGRTIKRVLDAVGDDPARARAVLDLETARGDEARTTLVDALARIAEQQ